MDTAHLSDAYLSALRNADLAAMLCLFTEDALVHSPLYGSLPAAEFYRTLFSDTGAARPTLLGTSQGSTADGKRLASIWFRFEWELPTGRKITFDVVDLLELADVRIAALRIVYDTAEVRPAFEEATGKPSWRPYDPKLRRLGCFHCADLGFYGLVGMAGVYVRARGMGAPIRSKARRWVGVGWVSLSTGWPLTVMVSRVRVKPGKE
jgi:SnoaL-like domain